MKRKTLYVSSETHSVISSIKNDEETFDDVIRRMIASYIMDTQYLGSGRNPKSKEKIIREDFGIEDKKLVEILMD